MNLGFRNRDNNCLFEKCMSSGRSFSSRLSETPLFLLPPMYAHCFAGNVNVPFAGGSNNFFSNSAVLRLEKSIENTSFSLRGLAVVDTSVLSAAALALANVKGPYRSRTFPNNLAKFPMFRPGPILGNTCVKVVHHASGALFTHRHN